MRTADRARTPSMETQQSLGKATPSRPQPFLHRHRRRARVHGRGGRGKGRRQRVLPTFVSLSSPTRFSPPSLLLFTPRPSSPLSFFPCSSFFQPRYGVRGHVHCPYDAETRAQSPGDELSFTVIQARSSRTTRWQAAAKEPKIGIRPANGVDNGGGGTVGDSITSIRLESDLSRPGNGAPWNRNAPQPAAAIILYLGNIVALNAGTGK